MSYAFDASSHPLILQVLSERVIPAEWAQLYSDIDAVLLRGQPFVVVCDASTFRLPDVLQLRQYADFLRARHDRFVLLHLGIASVTRSPMIRGSLKGVARMGDCPMPVVAFDCAKDALEWAEGRIDSLGVHVTPSTRAFASTEAAGAFGPGKRPRA